MKDVSEVRIESEKAQQNFTNAAAALLEVFEKEIAAAMDKFDATIQGTIGRDTLKQATDAYELMKQADAKYVESYNQRKALEDAQVEGVQ